MAGSADIERISWKEYDGFLTRWDDVAKKLSCLLRGQWDIYEKRPGHRDDHRAVGRAMKLWVVRCCDQLGLVALLVALDIPRAWVLALLVAHVKW